MVAARHNLTRRAVLGAAVGVPAWLGSTSALAAGCRPHWESALAAFRRAEMRLAHLEVGAPDDLFDDLDGLRLDALRRLLRVPAPDLRALSLKIDLAVDEEVGTLIGAAPCLATLKSDAWRLAYRD